MTAGLWAYMVTDDDGIERVAYMETTGGSRVMLVATEETGATLLRPVAARLAQIIGRPITLAHFTARRNVATLDPDGEGGPGG